ncbi:MAG: dihydrolipoyllysine-residue succinyltransferase [Candidatus Sumerlaeia bacterium]
MPHPIIVPELGESITEATIIRWRKNQGEPVRTGEILLELETEKVNLEVGADRPGVLARIDKQAGQDVKVGETIGMIDEAAAEETPVAAPQSKPQAPVQPQPEPAETPEPANSYPSYQSYESYSPEAPEPDRREERVRMTRRRRTIAERLVEAQHEAAMLTTFNEIDMSAVARIRAHHKEAFERQFGVRLGLLPFFVKAAVAALREMPVVNARIDGEEIVYQHFHDIGVAVDTAEGLVVPVIRDADRLGFADIEKAVQGMAERARGGKLTIDDLRGGTFTITNGGVYGSLLSTPILNGPQSAILGLHRIQDRPVAVDGQVAIRPMMYVALSYDHRLIDGRVAVQFLVRVKELVETPERLLVEM